MIHTSISAAVRDSCARIIIILTHPSADLSEDGLPLTAQWGWNVELGEGYGLLAESVRAAVGGE